MALMLAPYNEAMRIGMGFNSYTQQLCVNNIVQKPGGVRASERDLRAADLTEGMPPPSSGKETEIFTKPSGTVVQKHSDGGQADISQIVSWKSGIVSNLSDVTESLNITGALAIKCKAMQGGASASVTFEKSSQFLKSKANYNITVKVTNQRLVADDVTEFVPIPNVPASKFNEVYGDCFISGFISGGVLNAVIMDDVDTNSESFAIKGEAKVDIEAAGGAVTVSGSAKGGKEDKSKNEKKNASISVNWSGGGDIKPDNVNEWTIETVTRVAMEFPDKVAACPQRTFAILTKYTSLRSFYEQTVKGSPLDYEIAGIYTSSLLDAYMEYKMMWEDLHETIKKFNHGTAKLHRREPDDKLIAYGQRCQTDYDKRIEGFNKYKTALQKSGAYRQGEISIEEPLPPTKVDPYAADAFGLDDAARDCRMEMIKIVREVTEVTDNPKVATDPSRNWRYLSPHVFRLLLPTDKEPLPSPEEIAQTKEELEARVQKSAQEAQQKQREADEARREREALQTETDQVKRERSALQSEAEQARRERDALQQRLNDVPEVQVFSITYGGRQLLHSGDVEARIRGYISQRAQIVISNDFFGQDPLPGIVKQCQVAYQRRGEKPVAIEAQENTYMRFI